LEVLLQFVLVEAEIAAVATRAKTVGANCNGVGRVELGYHQLGERSAH